MEKKKLEKVDVDSLNEIRNKYQQNNLQLGMLTSDEYIISEQLKQVEEAKNNCFTVLNQLRDEEQTLVKNLEKKYGEGQINLEEGVFISNV